MVVRNGRKLAQPFLDISSQVTSGGEQGLLSMAFAPDYASSGRFYVYFTDNDGDQRVVEYRRGERRPRRRRLRAAGPPDGRQRVQPQRRAAALRPGRPPLHRHRRRRRRGRPARRARQRAEPRLAARQDPADRPAAGRRAPYSVPRSNPFVGRARRARRDLRLRPAQPVALLVRPPHARPLDRRRRAERGRGDRLRAQRPRQELRLAPVRGPQPLHAGETAPGHVRPVIQRFHSKGNCSITGGVVVRDRAVPALDGRYVFGDFCQGRVESARLRPGRRERPADDPAAASRACPRSARTRAGASTPSRSTGPVYRLRPAAERMARARRPRHRAAARGQPEPLHARRHEHVGDRA